MLGFWASLAESCMLSRKTLFHFIVPMCIINNNNNAYIDILPISTPFTILLSQLFLSLQHAQEEEVDGWGWCGAQPLEKNGENANVHPSWQCLRHQTERTVGKRQQTLPPLSDRQSTSESDCLRVVGRFWFPHWVPDWPACDMHCFSWCWLQNFTEIKWPLFYFHFIFSNEPSLLWQNVV